jgi:hypothetical protein
MKAGWTLVLVGLWLGALLASWLVASVNFRTVDRVLGPAMRPELEQRLAPLAPDDRRATLRHLASEINRWMFRYWSLTQVALGIACLLAAWRVGVAPRFLLAAALLTALIQSFGLTPPITELGRSIDFVPRPLPPETARRFGLLHAAYVGLDLAKAVLLAATVWSVARRLS